jgi:hypothetical protein
MTNAGAVSLPMPQIGQAAPPYTYIGIALHMVNGAKSLASIENPPPVALAMLAAHGLECILKAYLSRGGDDRFVKQTGIRHNLNELWSRSVADGLAVPDEPPAWVRTLSDLHDWPYHLRYSTGIHGMGVPSAQPMATELSELFSSVCEQISRPLAPSVRRETL